MNRRLCALSADGEFIKTMKLSFEEGAPRKLRSLPNGDIVIEMEKSILRGPDKPQDCALEIYSPDLEYKKTLYSHKVLRDKYITQKSTTFNIPQPFSPDVYWDVSPEGIIFIGFSEKYEIEIYDCDKGKLSSFSHTYEPVKITGKDKEAFFAGINFSMGGEVTRGAPDFMRKITEFPKFKPAFCNILVDSESNILVWTYRKNRKEDEWYFDVFDQKGNFIRNVQIVGDVHFPTRPVSIVNGSFWMRKTGEDGLFKVIKYRISD